MYFIKDIKTMPVVQELIEAFCFLCIATLSISSKFFDSIYVGSTENDISSPCQQNPSSDIHVAQLGEYAEFLG